MGIPSYFSYIVRNHRDIIRKLNSDSPDSPKINNLYLDCNSFIYDAHQHRVKTADFSKDKNFLRYEETLIADVCASLVNMIQQLKPNKRILIAFDGVAPMAKLDQQRNRRYMAAFQKSILGKPVLEWNTASITPGTAFMQKLGEAVTKRFRTPSEFGLEKIIVSSSAEPGEGEHKIYEYIRANEVYHRGTQTIIYGLDADLIMLTLNHLHISEHLYLYRETPEFIKTIDRTLNPHENYLLDIPLFAKTIIGELSGKPATDATVVDNPILFDYILLCFFLGNDFLPHFPALNIRTTGINHLINAYKFVFADTKETLTKNREIVWKNMQKFIAHLAANELEYIQEEYVQREKASKRLLYAPAANRHAPAANRHAHAAYASKQAPASTPEPEPDENLLLPLKERAHELYINPAEAGWEARYYKMLFHTTIDNDRRKEISTNYLAGLEWTMKYYSTGCPDWQWQYHYYYPPLLVDLLPFVPYFDHTFVPLKVKQPVSPLAQLSYVLPPASMDLLPYAVRQKLLTEQPEWYVDNYVFLWAFCKFFWEAHVELPSIDMDLLEEIVKN
jgi:5'-3' exonuclease